MRAPKFILNSRFLTQNLTGVQRYGFELFKQVNQVCDVENLAPEQEINKRYNIDERIGIKKIGRNKSHIWEQLDLPAYLNKLSQKPLLLNLCNTAPLFYKNQIVTVHDIAYLRGNWHSKSFRAFYKFVIPAVIKNSRHVITVSEFSKQEIVATYNTPPEKISVVYNAPFVVTGIEENPQENLSLTTPYILSVGSIDPRKNLKRLIKAFLSVKHNDIVLYLIGAHNPNFKKDPELDQLLTNNSKRIIFLGYRTDQELIYLYKNAQCFVYPSLYEGFGLPPIEAMANGCPVVTSNVSSLPEVCGKAAVYCDPLSFTDIADKINQVIENTQIRDAFIKDGYENSKKYSWENSGNKLVSVISQYI